PHGEDYQIHYVIDGITTIEGDRPREEALGSIIYLKAVAGLDVEDHRRPQEGSFFTIRTGQKDTGWRISTSGSTRGEQLSLERIEETKSFKIDTVGLHPDQLEMTHKVIEQPSGVILITGPKGSGATTTLYGLVRHHDAFIQNIHTLEEQCLMEVDNISQHELEKGPDARSNAQQLRSVLHVDPDVLMISFCNGKEMAQLTTKAANTGKKVYVGMSANNAFQALGEWIKMVGDNKKVADTLLAVTNQRLIRILCHECRQAYAPDVTMLKKLNLPSDKIKKFYRPPAEIEYDKHGNPILCPTCQGTGYFGRTAVFETFMISDDLRKLIAEDAPVNVLRTQCRKERMLFLQEQVLRKVIDGTTSIQEVLRVTAEPKSKTKKTTRKK
ncbi:MAG: Flp pilus assembly complex ATPase component TadA, partial [Sedimentisphaerales bacterium]|nr:Flp pilus assembly complex ATPase component TadA [Sedimentisphaerales bacterium]